VHRRDTTHLAAQKLPKKEEETMIKRFLMVLAIPLAMVGMTLAPSAQATAGTHTACTISIKVDHFNGSATQDGFVDAHGRSCSETYNSWAFFGTPTNALKHGRGTTSTNGSAISAQGNPLYGGFDRWQHNGTEHTYCTFGCLLFHKAGIRLAAFQRKCRPGWDDNVNTNNLTGAYAQADWETSGCTTEMQVKIICRNVVTNQLYNRLSGSVTGEEHEDRATCGVPDSIEAALISFNDGSFTEFWPSRKVLSLAA
jgi:hypothetical protein